MNFSAIWTISGSWFWVSPLWFWVLQNTWSIHLSYNIQNGSSVVSSVITVGEEGDGKGEGWGGRGLTRRLNVNEAPLDEQV